MPKGLGAGQPARVAQTEIDPSAMQNDPESQSAKSDGFPGVFRCPMKFQMGYWLTIFLFFLVKAWCQGRRWGLGARGAGCRATRQIRADRNRLERHAE